MWQAGNVIARHDKCCRDCSVHAQKHAAPMSFCCCRVLLRFNGPCYLAMLTVKWHINLIPGSIPVPVLSASDCQPFSWQCPQGLANIRKCVKLLLVNALHGQHAFWMAGAGYLASDLLADLPAGDVPGDDSIQRNRAVQEETLVQSIHEVWQQGPPFCTWLAPKRCPLQAAIVLVCGGCFALPATHVLSQLELLQ